MQESYKEFIENILNSRGRFACGEEYHERHHIVPRCMNGSDETDNLIDLFAREHFIVHKLLAQENPENYKLSFAYFCMSTMKNEYQERYELTPEEYEEMRIYFSTASSKLGKERMADPENNPFYGVHRFGEDNPNFGKEMKYQNRSANSIRQTGAFNPNIRPVYCIEMNRIFYGAIEAYYEYGFVHTNITKCCKKQKTHE